MVNSILAKVGLLKRQGGRLFGSLAETTTQALFSIPAVWVNYGGATSARLVTLVGTSKVARSFDPFIGQRR